MKLSSQQEYYKLLAMKLAEPFRDMDWKFSGFGSIYRKIMHRYWLDFYYEFGEGPLVEEAQIDLNDELHSCRTAGFVPDGFCIEDQTIHLLEIVETSDLKDSKIELINKVAWDLDTAYWAIDLVLLWPRQGVTSYHGDLLWLDGLAKKFPPERSPFRAALNLGIVSVPFQDAQV